MSPSLCAKRAGLTLLELVVVLGILAVLSTVAVHSLEPIADQARYESTQNLLNDLRQALVENPSTFVADTGTLPANVEALLEKPAGVIDRTLQSFDSDRDFIDDITLATGWNGPYLHLGAGLTEVLDGWGSVPTFSASGGALEIQSLGSDGDAIAPESGYRKDLSVRIDVNDYSCDLILRLYEIDGLNGSRIDPSPTGTEQLGVLFYGVNATGGVTGAVAEQLIVIANVGSFEVRRANTLVGAVAVRAILWDDTDSDDALDNGEVIVKKSIVQTPRLTPGNDVRAEMELR